MTRTFALTCAFVTLALGGFGMATPVLAQATPDVLPVDNPTIAPVVWQLVAIDNAGQPRQVPTDPSLYTVQFLPDGSLLIKADCNRGSGSYEISGYGLTIPPFATTLALCSEESLDSAFTFALTNISSFAYAHDTLVLVQQNGAGSLVFVPALSGVVWNLREIQGTSPATPSDPSAYTLTFDGAGSVAIRADCNHGSAGYQVDGNGLSFAPALMTRVACPPESLFNLYVQSLEAIVSYTFADGDLALGLSDGSSMIFTATIVENEQATPTAG